MQVVPFKSEHIDGLQSVEPGSLPYETRLAMETGNARTILLGDQVLMCGGVIQQWPGRSVAWALFDAKAGPHMRKITRLTREFFDDVPGRIEFTVRCDFPAGHTWARLLGFQVETPYMKNYGPSGEDHIGYVRFN